ncbi:MAG: bifunctional phosphoglucose/phosphomannose isomerase [Thermoplasmatota archaeon]
MMQCCLRIYRVAELSSIMVNDIKNILKIDKSNMLDVLADYPNHIKESIRITESVEIQRFFKIDNILISGMGASAISGDIVSYLFRDKLDVPVYVNRQYDIPKWANKDTLAIFISYSGNTEETLSSFKLANQKKCKIIGISSGGKLKEMCERRQITHISLPSGLQPRAATMLILFPLLMILKRLDLIKQDIQSDIQETIELLQDFINSNNKSIPFEKNYCKQLAEDLYETIPQIYGWGPYAPIAVRWRQQINENSKLIAREDVVSECNHNDIVGWSADPEVSKMFSCILFRDRDGESRNISLRLDFMKLLFESVAGYVIEIHAKGKSRLAKMMYFMSIGDFTSCYLAVLRNIDPSPVDIIMELKRRLAES